MINFIKENLLLCIIILVLIVVILILIGAIRHNNEYMKLYRARIRELLENEAKEKTNPDSPRMTIQERKELHRLRKTIKEFSNSNIELTARNNILEEKISEMESGYLNIEIIQQDLEKSIDTINILNSKLDEYSKYVIDTDKKNEKLELEIERLRKYISGIKTYSDDEMKVIDIATNTIKENQTNLYSKIDEINKKLNKLTKTLKKD